MENQSIQQPNISQAAYDRLDQFISESGFIEFAIKSTSSGNCKQSLLSYILLRGEQLKKA